MKLDKIKTTSDSGEEGVLSITDYQKFIIKEFPDGKSYESEEMGTVAFPKVVKHIVESLAKGAEVDEGIKSAYNDVYDRVSQDVENSNTTAADKKAEAAAAKEKKEKDAADTKAANEAKEKEKLQAQTSFVTSVADGVAAADNEFESELVGIRDSLPKGVTVVQKGGGFGISIDKDATQADIGNAMGYITQKGANSALIGNQLQFWQGDMILAVTESGLFPTAKEAGKFMAGILEKDFGKSVTLSNLDNNKRMAERTPIELRNPRADFTAYLAISNMKSPKKGDKESDADYKARLDGFRLDVKSLQEKLASGEFKNRKDVLKPVEDTLIKHGIKEAPTEDNQPSIGQQLAIYFHSRFALDNLLGIHEKDVIIYKDGESLKRVTKDEMEEKLSSAESALNLVFYSSAKNGITLKDMIRGFVEITKDVIVGKNETTGLNVVQPETVETKVYPNMFWSEPSKEEVSK